MKTPLRTEAGRQEAMTVDLAALAKLASEATPETKGNWRYRRSRFGPSERDNYGYVEWGERDGGYGTGTLSREMAHYIAAASPDVVAALVRVALAAGRCLEWGDVGGLLTGDVAALRAALEDLDR